MPRVVPRGNPDAPALEVADDQVSYWESVGYSVADGEKKKAPAKKSASRKSSK